MESDEENMIGDIWNRLVIDAGQKWLSPEEVLFVLLNFEKLHLPLNDGPPDRPLNGQIYIFDREKTKNFKSDGVTWSKKKKQNRIQETYETFEIRGYELHRVNCRSADDGSFQRRIFRLSKQKSPLVFVQYRLCRGQNETFVPSNISSMVNKFLYHFYRLVEFLKSFINYAINVLELFVGV
jgi:hypothetical protein